MNELGDSMGLYQGLCDPDILSWARSLTASHLPREASQRSGWPFWSTRGFLQERDEEGEEEDGSGSDSYPRHRSRSRQELGGWGGKSRDPTSFLLKGCVISGSRLKWSKEVRASDHDTR